MKTEIEMKVDESFTIGESIVTKIVVQTIGFSALLALVASATRGVGSDEAELQKAVERTRFSAQVQYYAGDTLVIPDAAALLQLPIKLARRIRAAFAEPDSKGGKIVDPNADGITSPIIYVLGTPIPTDKGEIKELEFQASTLGEVEDVLYRTNSHEQALALIRTVAVPLGQETTLMTMPAWAVDLISIADGVTIAQEVLPRFLD